MSVLSLEPRFDLHVPEGWSLIGFAKSYFIYLQETAPDVGACLHECSVADLSWSFGFHFCLINTPKMDYQEYLNSIRIISLFSFIFLFSCEVPDAEPSE